MVRLGRNNISMMDEDIKRAEGFFEKQLDRINTWLNFAEAKNAALIALNIALIAVMVNIFSNAKVLTVITVAAAMVSSFICLISFLPNLTNTPGNNITAVGQNPNLIYFGDISNISTSGGMTQNYVNAVVDKYFADGPKDKIKADAFIVDLASEIIINSQITVKKYQLFKWALRTDVAAFILTVVTFIVA